MARSPILSCGTRCRQTTSFSCRQEQFTRSARVSSSQSFNSGATRHSVCSITVASVNFMSKMPSWWRTPGRLIFRCSPNQLTAERRLFVSNPHFVFERIDLAPNSYWCLEAERETWLLVLERQCYRRIVRRCHGRCPFCAIGPRRHSPRRHRHGGPRGVHGRRPGSAPAAASHAAGLDRCRAATGDTGANFSHSSKGCPKERPHGNN